MHGVTTKIINKICYITQRDGNNPIQHIYVALHKVDISIDLYSVIPSNAFPSTANGYRARQ